MTDISEAMRAADEKLERDLTEIFSKLNLVPDAVVESIDHFGLCEDGRTFMLMATTADGDTLIVSIAPGSPISVGIQGTGHVFRRGLTLVAGAAGTDTEGIHT